MNERKDSSADGTAAAEPAATDTAGPSGTNAPPPNSRQGLAVGALVLALAALGLISWLWWQRLDTGESTRMDALAAGVEAQAADLQRLRTQIEAQVRRIESLPGGVEDRLQELENRPPAVDPAQLQALEQRDERMAARLDARLDALERDVSSQLDALDERLAAQPARPQTDFDEQIRQHRRELVLHETAALLRIGQSLAELGDDLSGARQAYARAAARLQNLDDRRATGLRQAVVRESELLAASSGPDWVEAVGQLAALSASAADWPLLDEPFEADGGSAQDEADGSGRWYSGIGRALGSLVQVTPREQTALPESVVESLRERIRLYLAAAEAAAARRNAAELAGHARTAMDLLDARFNAHDPAVARAREVLAGLAQSTAAERPDLGAALAEIERSLEAR